MAERKYSKGKNPNSLANLKKANPQNNFHNPEVARDAQKKSAQKRRENKQLTELLKLALTLVNEETGEVNGVAITNALINKAISGDVSAYQTIRDTVGEKPTDKRETKIEGIPTVFNILPVKGTDEL